jgi:hypothetical protein
MGSGSVDKHPNGQSPDNFLCNLIGFVSVIIMKHSLAVDKLAKMLFYMLGRHPEEFCLLPDENGYVKIKDLMKALGEEPRLAPCTLEPCS